MDGLNDKENNLIKEIVAVALQEDIGSGDITSLATIPPDKFIKGAFQVKERCVAAGLGVAEIAFKVLDDSLIFEQVAKDGDLVDKGDILAKIRGNGQKILMGGG